MKTIQIISLALTALSLLFFGACKKGDAGYQTAPPVAPGSYIDSGK